MIYARDLHTVSLTVSAKPLLKISSNITCNALIGQSHQKRFGVHLTRRSGDAWTNIKRRIMWFYLGKRSWYIRFDYE